MVDHGLTIVKLSFHGQFKVMFSGLTMVKLMVISWSVEGHVVLG